MSEDNEIENDDKEQRRRAERRGLIEEFVVNIAGSAMGAVYPLLALLVVVGYVILKNWKLLFITIS